MRSAISARCFDRLSMSGTCSETTPARPELAEGSRARCRIHRADRVSRAALATGQELVEDAPLAEQPAAVDPLQLVLVDPEGAHLEAFARTVVGHLEPLRAGPGL